MECYALRFLGCRVLASMSKATEWPTLKGAISMTTQLTMCARLLPLPSHLLHHPLELTLDLTGCCACARDFGIAECECSHFEPSETFPPLPLELTLDLTGCCARARGFGVAVRECLHFELPATFPPLPAGVLTVTMCLCGRG